MEKQNKPFIIGLTGAFDSGKSKAAEFFASQGFQNIVLSSFLEEEAQRRGFKKITRRLLQDIGSEFREKYGEGVLAKEALKILGNKKAVIDGIRNLGEIEVLRKNNNFILVAIVADRKIRFERLKKAKKRESLTWNLFRKLDYRDLGQNAEKKGLQTALCIVLADSFIENNGSMDEFKNKLENFLKNTI